MRRTQVEDGVRPQVTNHTGRTSQARDSGSAPRTTETHSWSVAEMAVESCPCIFLPEFRALFYTLLPVSSTLGGHDTCSRPSAKEGPHFSEPFPSTISDALDFLPHLCSGLHRSHAVPWHSDSFLAFPSCPLCHLGADACSLLHLPGSSQAFTRKSEEREKPRYFQGTSLCPGRCLWKLLLVFCGSNSHLKSPLKFQLTQVSPEVSSSVTLQLPLCCKSVIGLTILIWVHLNSQPCNQLSVLNSLL